MKFEGFVRPRGTAQETIVHEILAMENFTRNLSKYHEFV
jgi:hypothetical protein